MLAAIGGGDACCGVAFSEPPAGLGAAAAGFSFPKGYLGTTAAKYIDAFNSGNDSLVAEFHTTHFVETSFETKSMNSRLYKYQSLYKMFGELEPVETLKKSKSTLVIRARLDEGSRL